MEEEKDHFRESFNHFKQNRSVKELLSDSARFDLHNSGILLREDVEEDCPICDVCAELGLLAHQTWRIHAIKDLDGVFLISNPFTVEGQRRWIRKCLEEYPRRPSRTNLDSQLLQDGNDSWALQNDSPGRRLSWATLGCHHNWDTKVYSPSDCSVLPECLTALAIHVASRLGFETFEPEAVILNYYNEKSRLGIHNDHSEEDLTQPLLSVSFGLAAIFLVGTDCRKDRPVPLLLNSGDIVVLSGPSRLSYHAVPAIIGDSLCFEPDTSDPTWRPFHEYILTHRINISIRQVYAEGAEMHAKLEVAIDHKARPKVATVN